MGCYGNLILVTEKEEIKMILLTILLIMVILLTIITIAALSTLGVAGVIIFGDVIVCVLVLVWLIKHIWTKKK